MTSEKEERLLDAFSHKDGVSIAKRISHAIKALEDKDDETTSMPKSSMSKSQVIDFIQT